jgi:hypothetical protein
MGNLDQIFINVPALPGSNVCRKDINPDMLKAWCEAVELGIKTDAEHIAKALTLINKMSDIIDQLGDSVKVLSDRVAELQTVSTYLDERVQKLEAQRDSRGEV